MKTNKHLNYYPWLQDEEYAEECKNKLVDLYESYYATKDTKEKAELFKQLEVYLAVVCDIIAYRYLVKHYTNLFYKLCITVEEYMDYKVKRLLVTIKEKEEHINDILSYIYMSFMLSSPRLIYDYGEKIGRCQLSKENLPYYQVARNKFFSNTKEEGTEHIIFNVDTLFIDEDGHVDSSARSNIDRYSYSEWRNEARTKYDGENDFQQLLNKVENLSTTEYMESSKSYVLYLLNNWKTVVETDYQTVKTEAGFGDSYSLIDYIKYKYETGQTNLTHEGYLDVLKIFNNLLKGE